MKAYRIPIILLTLVILLVGAVPSWSASKMADLENALMCKCDDKCGKVLINCTCDTSKETRKHLMSQLESGLTVKQIIQQYVDKYGETVLSAPTKSGFNLSAWITPFAALLVGGLGVRKVIQTWTQRSGGGDATQADTSEETPSETGKFSRKLKDELDRLES